MGGNAMVWHATAISRRKLAVRVSIGACHPKHDDAGATGGSGGISAAPECDSNGSGPDMSDGVKGPKAPSWSCPPVP